LLKDPSHIPAHGNIGQKPKTFVDVGKKYVLVAEDNLMISIVIE